MSNLAVCVQLNNETVTAKETVDAISKAGFKNVFVQYYHRDNIDFDELDIIDYCKQVGLNIIFCHLGYKHINDIWLEGEEGELVTQSYISDLDIMHEKNINMVCMHLTTKRQVPMYNELGIERLRRIVEHAKELGIKIALENTRYQGYLEYALENIKEDNLGICLDVGHYHVHFDDKLNWDAFKNKIFAVHIHDNDKSLDQHLIPGEGTIDWKDVMSKLKEYGYSGQITLELYYRNDYLNMSIEEFYKKGYEVGKWLEEINK